MILRKRTMKVELMILSFKLKSSTDRIRESEKKQEISKIIVIQFKA